MIQRIQTIFLFLISVAMGVALASPIWQKTGLLPTEMAQMSAFQLIVQKGITSYITPLWYLTALLVGVATLSLYAIFQYKNRLLQTGLCAGNALLLTATMGVVLYQTLLSTSKTLGNPDDNGTFQTGFFAIVAALVCNAIANRFIRRDEKLVRESNRLR
jgi:Domain of unknown function (DUF4293)